MSFVEVAAQSAKEQYMARVWAMNHEQLFHELMRVHTESAKLLAEAQEELNRLKELLDGKTELARPTGDDSMAARDGAIQKAGQDRNDESLVLQNPTSQKRAGR